MKPLLILRLVRIFFHIAAGMATCGLVFPWIGHQRRNAHIRRWSRRLLAICNVTVEHSAGASEALEHAMIVSNHVSWLDIFVIDALHPCHFVAKAEIRAWPMLGWLAQQAGTVFISRGSKRDLRHIFKGLVQRLQSGQRVGVFPEGTTSAQGGLLAFHANLFEAAIDAKVPVQPFALSYVDAAGRLHPSVDFIGDMTFAASLMAILGGPPVRARLVCLPAISTMGAHRREVAQAAQASVAGALGVSLGG
ncbi:1-acyl-sn-glycerol-3-phosphate acyltransferase [Rugamonas sp.]|uniref:lysophospholipid acyltransferase family protein n=1 Tax=Rugamonas sp. TaxID=1926287 RepID=UPI0025F8936B|nr:lysophospholipid acyltransferase family protein [Rugamonas sp.]